MVSTRCEQLAREARLLYEQRLKALLEPAHNDEFVAIEPMSGEYFLGATLSEASGKARTAHPDRLNHVMRASDTKRQFKLGFRCNDWPHR